MWVGERGQDNEWVRREYERSGIVRMQLVGRLRNGKMNGLVIEEESGRGSVNERMDVHLFTEQRKNLV